MSGATVVGLLYALMCHSRAGAGIQGCAVMFAVMFAQTAVFAFLPTLAYSVIAAGLIVEGPSRPGREWMLSIGLIVGVSTAIQVTMDQPLSDTLTITSLALIPGSIGILRLQRIRARDEKQ